MGGNLNVDDCAETVAFDAVFNVVSFRNKLTVAFFLFLELDDIGYYCLVAFFKTARFEVDKSKSGKP